MEGISDIRISGLDAKRPPQIRKEPYINLFFELIHNAPPEWCDDFNRLVSKWEHGAKIDSSVGLFIETWVRKPDDIAAVLGSLKDAVSTCNQEYVARIVARASSAANEGVKSEAQGEQGRLNQIVAGLDFGDQVSDL